MSKRRAVRWLLICLLTVGVGLQNDARAADYVWQAAGTNDNWSTDIGDANWFISPAAILSPWTDANAAIFDAATGETVTIIGPLAPLTTTVGANNGSWTFANSGAGGVGGSLIKNGTGTLTLTGTTANAFTSTTINSGVVSLGTGGVGAVTSNVGALGTGDVTVNAGGSLRYWIQNSTAFTFANNVVLNGGTLLSEDGLNTQSGMITLGASGGAIRSNWADKLFIVSGKISGSGPLTVSTGPTANANGARIRFSGANDYTGPTTIASGTLFTANNSALGTAAAGTTINNGATLDIFGSNLGAEAITVNAGGSISNTGGDQLQALRFITLTGNATFTGTNRWDLRNNGGGALDMGGFTVTKTGANLVPIVSIPVNNPGNFLINDGILLVEGSTNLNGSAANSITIAAGKTLSFYQNTVSNVWTINSNGGTINNLSGATAWAGPLNMAATTTYQIATGTSTNFTGVLSGVGGVTKTEAGTLTLSGANIYTGNTTVNAGTIKANIASVAGISGAFGLNSGVTLADNATAIVDITGFDTRIGSLVGGGTLGGNVTLGAATLTVGDDNTNTTYAGVISGTGSFVKVGSGILTLSGANLYSGTTTVSAGTLQVSNTSGSGTGTGNVVVNSGATLTGLGSIAGAVNVAGSLAPGASPGTLSFVTDLTLNGGTTLNWELDPNVTTIGGGINDLAAVAGNLTLDGTLNVAPTTGNFAGVTGGTWTLFTYGTLTNNILGLGTLPALDSGYAWSLGTGGGAVTLSITATAVPEPSTLLAFGGAFAGLVVLRARRRRA